MDNDFKILKSSGYISYSWIDKIGEEKRLQQICLEPTIARNRGNLKAAFDTVNSLEKLKPYLTNYYFSEAIADLELRGWARLINETVNDFLIDLQVKDVKLLEDTEFFRIVIGRKELIFKSGRKRKLIFIEAESKDELFVIDRNDMFPRYYIDHHHALLEGFFWARTRLEELK